MKITQKILWRSYKDDPKARSGFPQTSSGIQLPWTSSGIQLQAAAATVAFLFHSMLGWRGLICITVSSCWDSRTARGAACQSDDPGSNPPPHSTGPYDWIHPPPSPSSASFKVMIALKSRDWNAHHFTNRRPPRSTGRRSVVAQNTFLCKKSYLRE